MTTSETEPNGENEIEISVLDLIEVEEKIPSPNHATSSTVYADTDASSDASEGSSDALAAQAGSRADSASTSQTASRGMTEEGHSSKFHGNPRNLVAAAMADEQPTKVAAAQAEEPSTTAASAQVGEQSTKAAAAMADEPSAASVAQPARSTYGAAAAAAVATANEEEDKKKRRKILLILLLLLLLLAGALGGAYLYNQSLYDNSASALRDVSDVDTAADTEDLTEASRLWISVSNEIHVRADGTCYATNKSGEAISVIDNIDKNSRDIKYTFTVDDVSEGESGDASFDDQVVYESGLITPGQSIEEPVLASIPTTGTYDVTVSAQGYDADSHKAEGGTVSASVTMIVE